MSQRFWPSLVFSFLVCGLSGCGFELRGSTNLPFKTISINVGDTSPVAVSIKRSIRGNGPTQFVSDPAKAEANLEIMGESLQTDILTINSLGLAAEYNLYYHVRFRVVDSHKHVYIPATELTLKRLVLANSNAILAENFEISQLLVDMQGDAAQQILRRMEAIKLGHYAAIEDGVRDDQKQAGPQVPLISQPVTPLTAPGT